MLMTVNDANNINFVEDNVIKLTHTHKKEKCAIMYASLLTSLGVCRRFFIWKNKESNSKLNYFELGSKSESRSIHNGPWWVHHHRLYVFFGFINNYFCDLLTYFFVSLKSMQTEGVWRDARRECRVAWLNHQVV